MKCYYSGAVIKKKKTFYVIFSLLFLLCVINLCRFSYNKDVLGSSICFLYLVCILVMCYLYWKNPFIKLDESKLILNQSGKPKEYLISEISIVKESDKSMVFLDKSTGKEFTIWLYNLTKTDVDEFKQEISTLINK